MTGRETPTGADTRATLEGMTEDAAVNLLKAAFPGAVVETNHDDQRAELLATAVERKKKGRLPRPWTA